MKLKRIQHETLKVNTKDNQNIKLKKIIGLLKSLKGKKPEYDNLDFSNYNQTEEEYQKEQEEWAREVKRKKDKMKK